VFWLCVLNQTLKIAQSLQIIRSVLRIEPTSSLFTRPAKPTNEFSNRTCMFIQPTCLMLSRNKKFEATLTHDIHWISVFKNQGVHHGKHRHQPFQKFAEIFVGLQLKIFKPREFYFIEPFTVQSMSRQSCYVYVKGFVYSCWHWAYLFTWTHM